MPIRKINPGTGVRFLPEYISLLCIPAVFHQAERVPQRLPRVL